MNRAQLVSRETKQARATYAIDLAGRTTMDLHAQVDDPWAVANTDTAYTRARLDWVEAGRKLMIEGQA